MIDNQTPSDFASAVNVIHRMAKKSSVNAFLNTESRDDIIVSGLGALNGTNDFFAVHAHAEPSLGRLDALLSQYGARRAAPPRIMDADSAKTIANLACAQILQRADLATAAQANALPPSALALLEQ